MNKTEKNKAHINVMAERQWVEYYIPCFDPFIKNELPNKHPKNRYTYLIDLEELQEVLESQE